MKKAARIATGKDRFLQPGIAVIGGNERNTNKRNVTPKGASVVSVGRSYWTIGVNNDGIVKYSASD